MPLQVSRKASGFATWLLGVSTLLCALFACFFLNGYWHQQDESKWVVFLFALPPLAQGTGLCFLYFKARKENSNSLKWFCILCFVMALCPLTYCSLWASYPTATTVKSLPFLWACSAFTVVSIIVLLIPVVLMTYSIMWTPDEHSTQEAPLLRVEEIISWSAFYQTLSNGYTDRTYPNNPSRRVIDFLEPEARGWIFEVGIPDDPKKTRFVEALNDILRRNDFYEEEYFRHVMSNRLKKYVERSQKDLTANEVVGVNRLLLEGAYKDEIKKTPLRILIPGRLFRWRENLFSNLKSGSAQAPFWALVFFFSVFLGIAYLIGFAFAFHDKQTILEKGLPALSSTYGSETSGKRQGGLAATRSDSQKILRSELIPWPSYTFYFESNSASFLYKPDAFDTSRYKSLIAEKKGGPKKKSGARSRVDPALFEMDMEWRQSKNAEHLNDLVTAIQLSTKHGKEVMVELRGSADDNVPQAASPYPSNYALSEARAQNMQLAILEKLSEKQQMQSNIHWLALPLSSEAPSKAWSQGDGVPLEKKRQRENAPGLNEQLAEDDKVVLDTQLGRINELYNDRSLSPDQENDLLDKVNQLRTSLIQALPLKDEKPGPTNKPTEESKQLQEEKLRQSKIDLTDSVDLIKHVDSNSGKRIVAASIKPLRNDYEFSQLALLDYMYFTLYTITTTGYGDIVPTTEYAKFLCSLANILEVFFLVVFFNVLVAVKNDGREPHSLSVPPRP
jgi:ion channel